MAGQIPLMVHYIALLRFAPDAHERYSSTRWTGKHKRSADGEGESWGIRL
jgi:hypothetical protein